MGRGTIDYGVPRLPSRPGRTLRAFWHGPGTPRHRCFECLTRPQPADGTDWRVLLRDRAFRRPGDLFGDGWQGHDPIRRGLGIRKRRSGPDVRVPARWPMEIGRAHI